MAQRSNSVLIQGLIAYMYLHGCALILLPSSEQVAADHPSRRLLHCCRQLQLCHKDRDVSGHISLYLESVETVFLHERLQPAASFKIILVNQAQPGEADYVKGVLLGCAAATR